MVLHLTVDGATGGEADAWRAELSESLRDADLEVLAPEEAGGVSVRIDVTTSAGGGTTDAGTPFESVRYLATVHVRRASIQIAGAPTTAAAAPDRQRAREDLLARLVPLLAY